MEILNRISTHTLYWFVQTSISTAKYMFVLYAIVRFHSEVANAIKN